MMTFDAPPAAPDWFQAGNELDARLELQVGGAWTDFTSRVFQDSVTIQRGHPDESTTAAPSVLTGTIDNHDGVLSDLNPLSPYYGELGLNTPLRASIPDVSPHVRLENDQASGVHCPGGSGVAVSSFEVWLDADADNWYTPQVLAANWNDTGNERGWFIWTDANGRILLSLGDSSQNVMNISSRPLPRVRGRMSIRVTWNATTGDIEYYTGQYCTSWARVSGGIVSPMTPGSSAANVEVGYSAGAPGFTSTGFNGKIYAFALIPSVGGDISTALASWDATRITDKATSFTDIQGNSWTRTGTAELSDRDYRFHGEAAAWPQSWTPGDPNARIALEAGGLLRRLGAANTSLDSAMYRAYTKAGIKDVVDYWPMEDGQNATQLASAMGGLSFQWFLDPRAIAPELSSYSGFPCSKPIPTWNQSSAVADIRPYATSTTAGASGADAVVRFLFNDSSGKTSGSNVIARMYFRNSATHHCDVYYDYDFGGQFDVQGYDENDNVVWDTAFISAPPNEALQRVSIELRTTGSNQFSATVTTVTPGATQAYSAQTVGNLAGKVGGVARIVIAPGDPLTSVSMGHVSVQKTWSPIGDLGGPLNAYAGEAAGVRFARLCAEEGIQFRGIGQMSDTTPMGAQGVEALATLLQECADADRGIWFEPRQCLGWGYRTRVSLGNQTAKVAFDYSQDHLSGTLEPTVDDQVVKNDITVTAQAGGSSSRQVLDDGSPRSVSKIGRYDTSLTVNLADDGQLDSIAGWALHTLTVNEPRYKALTCDLANAALGLLYWDALRADMGDRVTVRNPPVWLPPGLIDQVASGVTEVVSRKALSESWNGVPSTPWNVAYADDVVFGRADTDGSTLNAALSAPLNSNPFFQDAGGNGSLSGYVGVNGTIALDTAQAALGGPPGSFSCLFSSSLAGTAGTVQTQNALSVAVGDVYEVSAWVYVPSAGAVKIGVNWLNNGSSVSSSNVDVTVPNGQWAPVGSGALTVPSGTNQAVLRIGFTSTAGSGSRVWIKGLVIWKGNVQVKTSTAGSPLWTTSAADFPFDVNIGGEQVSVTGISGTSSPQTFTVARATNGVLKAQKAGADVRLWTPSIISL